MIATGSTVRKPDIKGIDAKGVHIVRTNLDQTAIKEKSASAKKIVVIGGSFIGSESASCLAHKEKEVHLVFESSYPLQNVLGKEVGQMMKSEHELNGVKLHPNSRAVEIKKNAEGHVSSVKLSDGTEVECDLVVLGTGVRPATDFLKNSDI